LESDDIVGRVGSGDTEGNFVQAGDAVFGDVFKLIPGAQISYSSYRKEGLRKTYSPAVHAEDIDNRHIAIHRGGIDGHDVVSDGVVVTSRKLTKESSEIRAPLKFRAVYAR
jgi:hypothetical protein